jgi:hypothetical protein
MASQTLQLNRLSPLFDGDALGGIHAHADPNFRDRPSKVFGDSVRRHGGQNGATKLRPLREVELRIRSPHHHSAGMRAVAAETPNGIREDLNRLRYSSLDRYSFRVLGQKGQEDFVAKLQYRPCAWFRGRPPAPTTLWGTNISGLSYCLTSSTRRFRVRPASESFEAIGA